jgi:hypothetical protein
MKIGGLPQPISGDDGLRPLAEGIGSIEPSAREIQTGRAGAVESEATAGEPSAADPPAGRLGEFSLQGRMARQHLQARLGETPPPTPETLDNTRMELNHLDLQTQADDRQKMVQTISNIADALEETAEDLIDNMR